MENTKTIEETKVYCIYENNELKGIIKKDMATRKNLIYLVEEASCEDIADLIVSDNKLSTKKKED